MKKALTIEELILSNDAMKKQNTLVVFFFKNLPK